MTREIAVADCETDPFKFNRVPYPFIWGFYNGVEYREFFSTEKFLEYVRDQPIILYAHNGGKFDWIYLIEYMGEFEEFTVINGRLAKFKIGECEFRDSYNILPIPLADYQKTEIDYSIFEEKERHKPGNMKKIRDYLKDDCVFLYNLVSEFVESYGINLTLASTAFKQWRKISGEKTPKTSSAFFAQFKQFYYGGRVQAFKSGVFEKQFKVIDINSAYPYAMLSYHPYGSNYTITDELPKTRDYISRCFIELECISIGALPYKQGNTLTFPDDAVIRKYFITGHEYLAGLDTKTIGNIKILTVYQFSDSIKFTDYIEHFFAMKDEAKKADDKAKYNFAKLFLTNLYGKFGSNPEKYREYMLVNPQYIDAAEVDGYSFNTLICDFALVSRPVPEEKQRFYNVATAASITGYVRAYLWRAICQCEGVMYCDTDSIVCEDTGALELDPSELGAWDIEAECYKGGIGGKKLYAFYKNEGGTKTASKGARLTHQQLMEVAAGRVIEYKPENPTMSIVSGVRFITRKIQKNA